ncbi:MAG: D-alanyl-D-alanine carboxypeptidase family protein [Sporolactobacillus sp.]
MKSFLTGLLAAVLLLTCGAPAAHAQVKSSDKAKATGQSAIVIEAETGQVLYQKNAEKELPPASMTKIMTMLLIFKAISHHQLALNDKVSVSEYAASMGGSQVFLEPGETMNVDEMLRAIAIASGNDASVAMAEKLSGSVKSFVAAMNAEAKVLGLKHTHFANPTGLPVANHYTTAHDMAVMARALARYPLVFHYTSKYDDYLRENTDKKFWLVNTNKLIKTYPGADGMKTGFTNEAKYCLTATAKREGMRLITVVMGAPTPKARNKEVADLMNQAFAAYETKQIVPKGKTVTTEKVAKGSVSHVAVVTEKPVVLLAKRGKVPKKLQKKIVLKAKLSAPLKAGSVVGYYIVSDQRHVLTKTPLVVTTNVNSASWWQLFKRSAGSIFSH